MEFHLVLSIMDVTGTRGVFADRLLWVRSF